MALPPTMSPSLILDQDFGRSITPQDLIQPLFGFGSYGPNYFRPWKWYMNNEDSCNSKICNENEKFQVTLDVQQFKPNEISVKVADDQIIIEGKHEERADDHGFISRQFTRRYALPKECKPDDVSSSLSSDGVLMVTAAKKREAKTMKNERKVPIEYSGAISKQKMDARQEIESKATEQKCAFSNGQAKTKNDSQVMLMEDHSRLFKPEFLKQSALGKTEKIMETKMESTSAMESSEMSKTEISESTKIGSCDISKVENTDKFAKKDKSDLCTMGSKAETRNASSMSATEVAASSSKTSETIEESTFTTTSTSSEMMQSEEISAFISSMKSNMKASENACDILSEIISQELKEAAENI